MRRVWIGAGVLILLGAALPWVFRLPGEEGARIVHNGIDVLREGGFAPLAGKRVGLVTNHTGLASDGVSTIEVLHRAGNFTLAALFSPEHGIRGNLDEETIDSSVDPPTGLPVHSLYGGTRRPTAAMLKGLDALVFDIQDVGARFYTYITTMGYCMEAAAGAGIQFYVLDRPNPIGGVLVEGPMLDPDRTSFVGYMPLPVRHGMTVGELARYFNTVKKIGVRLEVVPMRNWRRDDYFWDTGQLWVNPSPNMRTVTAALFYPGVCLLEQTNVSVGRGTDRPFELVGAPWVEPRRFAARLRGAGIAGVEFVPVHFTPEVGPNRGRKCGGVSLVLLDGKRLESVKLGLTLMAVLQELYPNKLEIDKAMALLGNADVLKILKQGGFPPESALERHPDFLKFLDRRRAALIYDLPLRQGRGGE
jgi:uncharacterized protein YbbC (DUF1343 family)